MNGMSHNEYMSIGEVAAFLGRSRVRIQQLVQNKRLKAERFGRDWFIKRDEVERFSKIPRRPGRPSTRDSLPFSECD
jgi:excisionase family DNA binding protein